MKKYDLPKKIVCGSRSYGVVYPYGFKEKTDLCGQSDHMQGEIRISCFDQGGCLRSDTDVIVTFFHELLHCIDIVYCQNTIGKERNPEELIDGISEGLAQAFVTGSFPLHKKTK